MKKTIQILLIVILVFTFTLQCFAEPNVAAPSAILIDAKSGKVLFEKNADEKRPPASTTKIMTAILVIEHGKLDEIVKISKYPSQLIEKGSSQISLIPDEELTLEQLLYGLMLESANDAAVAVAEHLTGLQGTEAIKGFAAMMNKRAKELGAVNTNFQNPNGLDKNFDNHISSARDLAIIARHAMTLPKFREVVSTVKYTIPATNKQPARDYIINSNKMIWKTNKSRAYEYCNGIKTGFTAKSKHCFVASAKKDNKELIAVVLGITGENGSNIYIDTKAMFEYGFNTYDYLELLKKDQVVGTVKIDKMNKSINLLAGEGLQFFASPDEKNKIQSKIDIPNKIIKAPVKKGDILGTITFSSGTVAIGKVNLLAGETVEKPKTSIVVYLVRFIIILIGLIILWMLAVAAYRYYKRRYRYKKYRLFK